MISKRTSPTPIRDPQEQLRALYFRRSVVDRLIRSLTIYQRITPVRAPQKKDRVA